MTEALIIGLVLGIGIPIAVIIIAVRINSESMMPKWNDIQYDLLRDHIESQPRGLESDPPRRFPESLMVGAVRMMTCSVTFVSSFKTLCEQIETPWPKELRRARRDIYRAHTSASRLFDWIEQRVQQQNLRQLGFTMEKLGNLARYEYLKRGQSDESPNEKPGTPPAHDDT